MGVVGAGPCLGSNNLPMREKMLPKKVIDQEIENILKNKYPEEAEATLGENRGQLFVRIPQVITDRMKLKKGQRLLFKAFNENGDTKLDVEVIK